MSDQIENNKVATPETKPMLTERPRFQTKASERGLDLSILLPGVPKDGLSVEIENRVLKITGERPSVDLGDYGEQVDEARKYELLVKVHDDFDTAEIPAKLENGILQLTLQKRQEIAKRSIDILAN